MNKQAKDMLAVVFDGSPGVRRLPIPQRKKNEILIKVELAGICNTDLEILKGYVPGFNAILGHEFIGTVAEAGDPALVGKRCTAEINSACGTCDFCRQDLGRHCPNRTVLGIINQNGAFAEYIPVPEENLVLIPEAIPDHNAVFIEPLAAALEILDQVEVLPSHKVLLLGDGKLGLMVAHAMASTGCNLTVVGKHRDKLGLLKYGNLNTVLLGDFQPGSYDIVVEAAGKAEAFDMAVNNVKPRGTIVLKSTYAGAVPLNLSPVVVNEITLVGSRCGLFSRAVDFLLNQDISFESMITHQFPLDQALEAFEASKAPGALKVLLKNSSQ